MKADWDDAPRRKRSNKKRSNKNATVIFASVLGLGCAYLAAPMLKQSGYEDITGRLSEQPIVREPSNTPYNQTVEQQRQVRSNFTEQPQRRESSLTDEDVENAKKYAELYWYKPQDGDQEERQTVFNESNYSTAPTINTMESRHATNANNRQNTAPRSRTVSNSGLNGTSQVILKWRDARGRESRWPTTFSYRNSQIDNNSFCRNYRSGSIDYRTCRKAAKEWLNGRCGTGNRVQGDWQRMYCLAANGFRT